MSLARNTPAHGTARIIRYQSPGAIPFIARMAEGVYEPRDRLQEIALAVERFIPKILPPPPGTSDGLSQYGVETMPKPESFPIEKIYVPVKRKKALRPDLVQEIAESILEIGQQAPILVRPDQERFVLVEGLHRFEACKALGETTVIGLLVSGEVTHQKMLSSHDTETEAARDKMARLKRLRLEKEAAERLTSASSAAGGQEYMGQLGRGESPELPRKRLEKGGRNNLNVSPSQLNRRTSGSTPRTLLDWLTQQKRDGGRY